jgi:hypothetical protein
VLRVAYDKEKIMIFATNADNESDSDTHTAHTLQIDMMYTTPRLHCLCMVSLSMLIASIHSLSMQNRARFLSSTAAKFVTASTVFTISSADPETCQAAGLDAVSRENKNPRYIDKELQMNSENPRSRGILVRRLTGDSTPYSFPVK